MGKTIIIITLLALFSCGKSDSEKKNADKKDDRTEIKDPKQIERKIGKTTFSKDDYTILETINNMDWVFGKDYKEWKPAQEDIEYALLRIDTCFDDQKRGTVNRLLNRKPEDYCMQFMGAINSKGEKMLWINAFCKTKKEFFKGWEEKLIGVEDGGNCYYNVLFNVDKPGAPYKLIVNGNA